MNALYLHFIDRKMFKIFTKMYDESNDKHYKELIGSNKTNF